MAGWLAWCFHAVLAKRSARFFLLSSSSGSIDCGAAFPNRSALFLFFSASAGSASAAGRGLPNRSSLFLIFSASSAGSAAPPFFCEASEESSGYASRRNFAQRRAGLTLGFTVGSGLETTGMPKREARIAFFASKSLSAGAPSAAAGCVGGAWWGLKKGVGVVPICEGTQRWRANAERGSCAPGASSAGAAGAEAAVG